MIRSGEKGYLKLTGVVPEFNLPNKLHIYFDDELVNDLSLDQSDINISKELSLSPNTVGVLCLELENAISPYEVGVGDDKRPLGMQINELSLNPDY